MVETRPGLSKPLATLGLEMACGGAAAQVRPARMLQQGDQNTGNQQLHIIKLWTRAFEEWVELDAPEPLTVSE
jgi:hypothetical protein